MARKRKSKVKSFLRLLLLFLFVPAAVWTAAFLVWFYWYDLNGWWQSETAGRAQPKTVRQTQPVERRDSSTAKRLRERILDTDRKKLDELLKQRN